MTSSPPLFVARHGSERDGPREKYSMKDYKKRGYHATLAQGALKPSILPTAAAASRYRRRNLMRVMGAYIGESDGQR